MAKHELDALMDGNVESDEANLKRLSTRTPEPEVSREQRAEAPIFKGPGATGVVAPGQIFWADADMILPNPEQPRKRYSKAKLEDLATSFNKYGQLQAAMVRQHPDRRLYPGRFQLVFAHSRHLVVAKKLANAGTGLPDAARYIGKLLCYMANPAIQHATALEMLDMAMSENEDRSNPSPLEMAGAYRRWRELLTSQLVAAKEPFERDRDTGLASWREVARRRNRNHVDLWRYSQLLSLPEAIQNYFEPDDSEPDKYLFNERHGRALLKLRDEPDEQLRQARAIARERLAATKAEKAIDEYRSRHKSQETLKVEEAIKAEDARRAAESAAQAARENAEKLARGTSHLSAVPNVAPTATPTLQGEGGYDVATPGAANATKPANVGEWPIIGYRPEAPDLDKPKHESQGEKTPVSDLPIADLELAATSVRSLNEHLRRDASKVLDAKGHQSLVTTEAVEAAERLRARVKELWETCDEIALVAHHHHQRSQGARRVPLDNED